MYRQVLLIDDEPAFLRSLALYLEDAGYQVLTAANASLALAVLGEHQPDAIVCDLRMPGMEGVEFFHRVQQNPDWHSIPFILLSGAVERSLLDSSAELGVRRVLGKPFDPDDLLAILREDGKTQTRS